MCKEPGLQVANIKISSTYSSSNSKVYNDFQLQCFHFSLFADA
jgi:hypothetical protein